MAMDQSALLELIEVLNTGDGEAMMRSLLTRMLQELIDAETTAHIGAGPHERTAARLIQRHGSRWVFLDVHGRQIDPDRDRAPSPFGPGDAAPG